MSLLSWIEHGVFALFIIYVVNVCINEGIQGISRRLVVALRKVPVVEGFLQSTLSKEAKTLTRKLITGCEDATDQGDERKLVTIPENGIPHDELRQELTNMHDHSPGGKMFAYVYTMQDKIFALQTDFFNAFCEKTGLSEDHDRLLLDFHNAFMHENALNPIIFPSLRRFETETCSMVASMLNGDGDVVGSVTSGGTESILMAMLTYRNRARKLTPRITHPEMVAPITIHPAHAKAAEYFGFTIKYVPVNDAFLPDIEDYKKAITDNTIALLSSAPHYPQGIIDPIAEISQVALEHGLPLHVDSCFGGFMLPWVEKLGHPVKPFDFRLPGVTSISADIHKYGFGIKGASVVLYRNEDIRKHQIFAYSQWTGGYFGSPSMAGTRPGGNLAAAWVTLKAMGQDGYMKIAKQLMDTTQQLKDGINAIDGLCILGEPQMTAFAIGSNDPSVNMQVIADVLETRGWKPERQHSPDCLHCTIMPYHTPIIQDLLEDLRYALEHVKNNKELGKKGTAAMYGMIANIPDKTIVDDFIVNYFNEMYKM